MSVSKGKSQILSQSDWVKCDHFLKIKIERLPVAIRFTPCQRVTSYIGAQPEGVGTISNNARYVILDVKAHVKHEGYLWWRRNIVTVTQTAIDTLALATWTAK